MSRRIAALVAITVSLGVPHAMATNGDNLIGVGPVSRAMGGVGVAAPQDSITAIFGNPAAMSFCPCGQQSETIFGGTIFDPKVNTKITTPMGAMAAESQHEVFIIPAVGVNTAIGDNMRFGIGAFGISGLGVDYRNSGFDLDGDPSNGYEGDLYTRLEIMKFAPMLSYKVNEDLSVGLSLHVAYNNLDLGQGGSHGYSFGAQAGALWNLGPVQLGGAITTPQKATHERVFNFDAFMGDTMQDDLDLEAPLSVVVGAAMNPMRDLLLELNVKYFDWAGADGYSDFDWDDQFVFALGAQYRATDELFLRAGFNYGENPVKTHDGFDPQGVSQIQGKSVPTFGYEMLRIVGFPAIVESHLTLGLGYMLTESLAMNLDYMHAFENTFSQSSMGDAIKLESSLEENAIGFSLAWQFE